MIRRPLSFGRSLHCFNHIHKAAIIYMDINQDNNIYIIMFEWVGAVWFLAHEKVWICSLIHATGMVYFSENVIYSKFSSESIKWQTICVSLSQPYYYNNCYLGHYWHLVIITCIPLCLSTHGVADMTQTHRHLLLYILVGSESQQFNVSNMNITKTFCKESGHNKFDNSTDINDIVLADINN
jgi:hypothetical protein